MFINKYSIVNGVGRMLCVFGACYLFENAHLVCIYMACNSKHTQDKMILHADIHEEGEGGDGECHWFISEDTSTCYIYSYMFPCCYVCAEEVGVVQLYIKAKALPYKEQSQEDGSTTLLWNPYPVEVGDENVPTYGCQHLHSELC